MKPRCGIAASAWSSFSKAPGASTFPTKSPGPRRSANSKASRTSSHRPWRCSRRRIRGSRCLRNQVAALEAQVAAAGPASDLGGEPLSPYEIELADLDSQLEAFAQQRADLEKRLAELQETISATPANALRLDELQRDFESVRAQYDSAVQRRAWPKQAR
jgi:hypothetical protein